MFREVLSVRFEWYLQTHVRSFSNHFGSSTDTYRHLRTLTYPPNARYHPNIKPHRNTHENLFIYYENIASLQLFPIRIIFSAGLYRRGISPNNNLSSPRNNRFLHGKIEKGICVGVQVTSVARANNETGVHHFTLHTFSI